MRTQDSSTYVALEKDKERLRDRKRVRIERATENKRHLKQGKASIRYQLYTITENTREMQSRERR